MKKPNRYPPFIVSTKNGMIFRKIVPSNFTLQDKLARVVYEHDKSGMTFYKSMGFKKQLNRTGFRMPTPNELLFYGVT